MWKKINGQVVQNFHSGAYYQPPVLQKFIAQNHIVRYFVTSEQDWARFFKFGRDTFGFPHIVTERMPFSDHSSAFKTKSNTVCYVSQPYENAKKINPMLNKWAADRGLAVDIYEAEHSWYYPGCTCLIVLHLPDSRFEVI